MILLGYMASILMGLSLGLVGGGGSILTVPILVYLFGVPPVLATAYSLFIVGLIALVGAVQSYRAGQVELKQGLIFAVPSFLGVYGARAYLLPSLPDLIQVFNFEISKAGLIMGAFAVLMLLASGSMIFGKSPAAPAKGPKLKLSNKKIALIAIEGLVVGAITGFVGAGGGFLIIPALVILVSMPMKMAVGTSLMIIASKSLFGFLGDIGQHGGMDVWLLVKISAIAIVGLFIGSYLKSRINETLLKKGFGYFVLIMGTFILLDQIL